MPILLDKLPVARLIEYATLIGLIFAGWVWLNDTIATKQDILITRNIIELGQINSNMLYYTRIGLDNLKPSDKEAYEDLKSDKKQNEKQHSKLLGLD